jgi:glycosyltransferase 2 family protein
VREGQGHVTATTESQRPAFSWKVAALRLGGSALLLTVLFVLLPLDELWAAVARVPIVWWIAGVGTYLCFHLIGVVKWRLLVNAAGGGLPALHAVRCYYVGLFSNTFLPSVVGGDVVRGAVALRRVRSRAGLLLGSLADRVQDVFGLAAVAALGALLLPTALDEGSRRVFMALFAVAVAGAVMLIVVLRVMPWRRLPLRVRRKLVRVRAAFRSLSSRPRALVTAFMLGMLLQTLQVLLNAWLGRFVGLDLPIQVWLFAWPLAKIAATLPLTQGGLGVREAALAALLAPFGVPPVLAVAVSLVFQVVVISGGLIGGAISLVLGRIADGGEPARGRGAALAVPR